MSHKILLAAAAAIIFLVLIVFFSSDNNQESASSVSQSQAQPGPEPAVPPVGLSGQKQDLPADEFAEPTTPPAGLAVPAKDDTERVVEDVAVEPALQIATENLAPDFSLERIDGKGDVIRLSDYRGVKPVILDFFAPHCPNCRRNIQSQIPLYEKYKDQIEVIIITGIDPLKMNENYFTKTPVDMPVVYDHDLSQTHRNYNIRFTNTHVLVNKDGSLEEILHGSDIIESDFKRLLN